MRRCAWVLMIVGLSAGFSAHGEEDPSAQALAATCTGCHGTGGVSSGPIPSIGGMEAQRMAALLHEFRDGKRPATIMHQLAKGYTDAQIEALSRWFATH